MICENVTITHPKKVTKIINEIPRSIKFCLSILLFITFRTLWHSSSISKPEMKKKLFKTGDEKS